MEQGQLNEVSSGQSPVGSQLPDMDNHWLSAVSRESSGVNPQVALNPWLVVKTKTKCEKFVRDKIRAMGMDAFVPLKRRTAKYNRKVKVYELPLITCYTFVRLDKERRNQVLGLPYVQGMLRMNGKDCLVSDAEMKWLQKVSGSELDVTTEILSMQQGDRVMLAYGQLAGMEGKIVSRRSKHEVVVALESLGLQMVIQVDPSMLVRQ
jgi:transcription antitermination factor NusG